MKVLLIIAWRNIWRSKLRSSVVIAAIGVGLFGGLFASAWMIGMGLQRVDNAFKIEIPHIQIQDSSFVDNLDIKNIVNNSQDLMDQIKEIDSVEFVHGKLICSAMAATANKNAGVIVYGINPESHNKLYNMPSVIDSVDGNFFEDDKDNTIVISKALAKELKVRLKSKVVLTFQDIDGNITGSVFKVRGVFKTDNSAWDKGFVFVREDHLRKSLKIPSGQYHQIDIKIKDYKSANYSAMQIQKLAPGLRVQSWVQIQPILSVLSAYMDYIMLVFLAIILAALGFGIVNTMLMVILERTREIGMLMAIGLNKKRLFVVILFETIMLSLVGAVLGEIVSYFAISYFSKSGIDLSQFADGLEAVGYSAISYPQLSLESYFSVTIMVVVTAVISSIYPALKALKLHPSQAIRSI